MSWIPVDAKWIFLSFITYPLDVPIIATGWTLSYEVVFYAVALALVTGKKKLFRFLSVLWFVIIAIGTITGEHVRLTSFITSPLFLEFYFGITAAYLIKIERGSRKLSLDILIIGIVWVMVSWIGTCYDVERICSIHRVVRFGLPFAMVVFGAVGAEMEYGLNCTSRFVKALSLSTYSLYLIHYPLISIMNMLLPIPPYARFIVTIITCISVGVIGYRWIEKPLTDFLRGTKIIEFD